MNKSYYRLIPERGWHPLLPGWVLVAEPGLHQGDAGSFANHSFWAWATLRAPSPPTPAAKLASCVFLHASWVVSVVFDSLWPHELYPARFLCPWNYPGKNTGVGCHALLQGILDWLHPVRQISKHQLLGAPEAADTQAGGTDATEILQFWCALGSLRPAWVCLQGPEWCVLSPGATAAAAAHDLREQWASRVPGPRQP